MEIYNNVGYDLLDENPNNRKLEDLPKVKVHKNAEGGVEFSNLKNFQVNNEEDMLNLLFIGDTNRVICQTPLNDVSTRSHCVFMITCSPFPLAPASNRSGESRSAEHSQNSQQTQPGRFVRFRASVQNASGRANPERSVQYQFVAAFSGVCDYSAQQGQIEREQRAHSVSELDDDDGAQRQVHDNAKFGRELQHQNGGHDQHGILQLGRVHFDLQLRTESRTDPKFGVGEHVCG